MKVSSKFHIGKVILFLIITPIITWYGHQKYTNPFMYHPNIAIDYKTEIPALLLYKTNYRDTINRIRLTFTLESPHFSGEEVVLLSPTKAPESLHFKGSLSDSTVTIVYSELRIIIPFGSIPSHTPLYPTDILLIPHKSVNTANQWRNYSAPRLTIMFDSPAKPHPENFKSISKGNFFEVANGRFKTLKLD